MRLKTLLLPVLAVAALVVPTTAGATPTPLQEGQTRLSGSDRFATAAAISKASFEAPVESVFIASALDYPDALSAGPAAASIDSPILLVDKNPLNGHTRAELERLKPEKIYIVGGTGVVTAATEQQLSEYGAVSRFQGVNRYETAAAISKGMWESASTVVLASGTDFADALSGGPAAAAVNAPMLLTGATLPQSTTAELQRLKPTTVHLLGGTGAISAAVEAEVKSATKATVHRHGGKNRFETSAAIAKMFWATAPTMFFATGLDYPDAVAGTPAAAVNGAPIVLTEKTCMPPAIGALKSAYAPRTVAVLGGKGVIADSGVKSTCTPPPTPGSYSGSGDDVVSITKPGGATAFAIATITHRGSSNFIVKGIDNQMEWVDLMVNEIGDYTGTVFVESDVTHLEITADGPWTVHIKTPSAARAVGSGASGQGDDVLRWSGGAKKVHFTHDGTSNFIVLGLDNTGEWDNLYINEIGPYSGSKVIDATTHLLTVRADGAWTMAVQ